MADRYLTILHSVWLPERSELWEVALVSRDAYATLPVRGEEVARCLARELAAQYGAELVDDLDVLGRARVAWCRLAPPPRGPFRLQRSGNPASADRTAEGRPTA